MAAVWIVWLVCACVVWEERKACRLVAGLGAGAFNGVNDGFDGPFLPGLCGSLRHE